jgi:predicted flap endonuclease-1-like 5' DNA nuclease
MASAGKARAREAAVASSKIPPAAPDAAPASVTPDPAAPPAADHSLDTSLRYLPGVGPKRAERLEEGLGLRTVGDLL